MKLVTARVQNYRSINDTGDFEIEEFKTILVGPNEAGKTAVLKGLESLNPPNDAPRFDWLRDYPRARLNEIQRGQIKPENVVVCTGHFEIDQSDHPVLDGIDPGLKSTVKGLVVTAFLDNKRQFALVGGPSVPDCQLLLDDVGRLSKRVAENESNVPIVHEWGTFAEKARGQTTLTIADCESIAKWIDKAATCVDGPSELDRIKVLRAKLRIPALRNQALQALTKLVPTFIYFSEYYKVRAVIHLRFLADRLQNKTPDEESSDFGNKCLLQLLGFTAKELADLGDAPEPAANDRTALERYRAQLDTRQYKLNAADVQLSASIQEVWQPDPDDPLFKEERMTVRLVADRQYLKAVIEDELGVLIEVDQRSAGFQWLFSFFVVFQAQARDAYARSVLLLDEPGMSLHALKQMQMRKTVSALSKLNQTIYTTHSPFLIGGDELDLVRLVELVDRRVGTKIHNRIAPDDPRSIYPLQMSLGYSLSQSLYGPDRTLVCEGLTDYWFIEGIAALMASAEEIVLDDKITLVPAGKASRAEYISTILRAQNVKVAALFDSDIAGDQVANQQHFVEMMTKKRILRTKDVYDGPVAKPEIEDLLRDTLIEIARDQLGWNIETLAAAQSTRSVAKIFESEAKGFSKYKLAKAFLRWAREHSANDLKSDEIRWCRDLVDRINKATK